LDAYPAYDEFFVEPERELVEVGCFAHARRHIYQARETDPARMGAVLAYIGQLYAVEKRARKADLQGDDLRQLRQEVSRPIANQLHAYLLSNQLQLLPKSAWRKSNWFSSSCSWPAILFRSERNVYICKLGNFLKNVRTLTRYALD
jgi:transposase